MGEGYNTVAKLAKNFTIQKQAFIHLKKWWTKELTDQKMRVRQAAQPDYNFQGKIRKKMIPTSKRQCWRKFPEEQGHRHHWQIMAMAKYPSHMNNRMGDLITANGGTPSQDTDKLRVLTEHNFISDPKYRALPCIAISPVAYRECSEQDIDRRLLVLWKTKKALAPGPDGISYRLIKLIQKSRLGKAFLNDITPSTSLTTSIPTTQVPLTCPHMKVIMIPKPNKDHR